MLRWGIIGLSIFSASLGAAAMAQEADFLPVNGRVTSPFGWRVDPMNGTTRFHAGLDIAAATGTPVYASQPGTVVFSGPYGGYGNVVVLDHGHSLYTLYGHNSQVLVQAGQYVGQGQPISLVGSTGRSTGPHLHFEVHYNRQYINPVTYLSYLQPSQPINRQLAKVTPMNLSPTPRQNNANGAVVAQAHSRRVVNRRQYSNNAYGRKVVQLVSGSNVENVEF
jgi:murein DD-endopeptidase MepM/ murein hydrolase activator NlpD